MNRKRQSFGESILQEIMAFCRRDQNASSEIFEIFQIRVDEEILHRYWWRSSLNRTQ
jgi:hypothetical protein